MRNLSIILAIVGLVFVFGCSKAQQPVEVVEPEVPTINITPANVSETTLVETTTQAAVPVETAAPASIEEVALTNENIQTALKNLGLYTGVIDGKIGPNTKKAIEEFQAQNGLKVDGKVGPMTWSKLKAYVNAAKSN